MIKHFCDFCEVLLPDEATENCCGEMLCMKCEQARTNRLLKELSVAFPSIPKFKSTYLMHKHLLEPGKVQLIKNGYFLFNGIKFTVHDSSVQVELLLQGLPMAILTEYCKMFKGDSLTLQITEGRMKVALE